MPRKKAAEPAPAAPPSAPVRFFFAAYPADLSVEAVHAAVTRTGGTVAETLSADTTYLVLDRINPSKKSRIEKQADKLNAAGATIQVLDRPALLRLLALEPAEPAEPVVPLPDFSSGKALSPATVRKQLLQCLLSGPTGVKRWNDLTADQRREAEHFRKADLTKGRLREADLHGLDFHGACLDGASLIEARLDYGDFRSASFLGANLRGADLRCGKFANARFEGAVLKDASLRVGSFRCVGFRSADLSGADLCHADLCGADFAGALFDDRTAFEKAQYDCDTIWPRGFKPGDDMVRVATAEAPLIVETRADASRSAGSIDIATFVTRIESRLHRSEGGRRVLDKVKAMLKAEKFRLFAEVEAESVVGVVKSQFDPDPQAVYSCRLTAGGHFDCYSPKLPVCGGMKYGGPCKHLLVLLIGLVRAGQLDATTADWWLSQARKKTYKAARKADDPADEPLFETLLKYKGAEAGQIDWRPTETVPEDYYAL